MNDANEMTEGEYLSTLLDCYEDEDFDEFEGNARVTDLELDRAEFSCFVPVMRNPLAYQGRFVSNNSNLESLIKFKENWAVFQGKRYPKYWARQAVNSEKLTRNDRIKRIARFYLDAAYAKTGTKVVCPCCETEFIKAVNQKFCKAKFDKRSSCKDFFHNFAGMESLELVKDEPAYKNARASTANQKETPSSGNDFPQEVEKVKPAFANKSVSAAKEHHGKNQSMRIGSTIYCATCGKSFPKKTQKQACCSLTCNVKYQNFIRSK